VFPGGHEVWQTTEQAFASRTSTYATITGTCTPNNLAKATNSYFEKIRSGSAVSTSFVGGHATTVRDEHVELLYAGKSGEAVHTKFRMNSDEYPSLSLLDGQGFTIDIGRDRSCEASFDGDTRGSHDSDVDVERFEHGGAPMSGGLRDGCWTRPPSRYTTIRLSTFARSVSATDSDGVITVNGRPIVLNASATNCGV